MTETPDSYPQETDPEEQIPTDDPPQQDVDDLNPEEQPEPETPQVPAVVEVLAEDPGTHSTQRRRKVVRRESRPLTPEERREIDDEIVKSNQELKRLEDEKAAAVKKYNGAIAEQRQILDDAISVLAKDNIQGDAIRMEVCDYERGVVQYFTEEGDELVDERDLTEDEKQTRMNLS